MRLAPLGRGSPHHLAEDPGKIIFIGESGLRRDHLDGIIGRAKKPGRQLDATTDDVGGDGFAEFLTKKLAQIFPTHKDPPRQVLERKRSGQFVFNHVANLLGARPRGDAHGRLESQQFADNQAAKQVKAGGLQAVRDTQSPPDFLKVSGQAGWSVPDALRQQFGTATHDSQANMLSLAAVLGPMGGPGLIDEDGPVLVGKRPAALMESARAFFGEDDLGAGMTVRMAAVSRRNGQYPGKYAMDLRHFFLRFVQRLSPFRAFPPGGWLPTLGRMNESSTSFSSPPLHLDLATGEKRPLSLSGIRREFERWGVVVFPRFFAEEELLSARKAMDEYFAPLQARAMSLTSAHHGEAEKSFACDVIPWDPLKEKHPVFRNLHNHPALVEVTEAMLGAGFTAPGSLVMFSVGGGRGQAWHQDCPVEATRDFNLNRLIYTGDVSVEDGAIVVVPGSHRMGRIPPGGHQDPMDGEVVLTPKAGTLVFLHGHVYHRVTPNLNRKPRVSVNFRAFCAGTSPDVTCIGVYRNGTVNFCDKPKHHDGTPAEEPVMGNR